ncbi:MAG: alpha/beta hydrolase [Chloroflexi bacterium]|nr:alpha/beta hydrolase [Chloroflexota bacterium]
METELIITHSPFLQLPIESVLAPTRYGDTHILASGPQDAPPLVLLPAMGVTSRMWQPNRAALGRDYRTYALDVIGDMGKSVLYDQEHYPKNGQAHSEWLVDVFDEIGIEGAHVIGASMGGWIAMSHAIHAPERVKRMVLLRPMGLPSWWTTLKVLSHLWSVFLFPTQSNIERTIHWALGENSSVRAAADFIATGARNFSTYKVAPPLPVLDDQLRKIKTPMLLMLGERDNVIGNALEIAKRARRFIPHVTVDILPNTGHMMNTEKPEYVNARILSFLQEVNHEHKDGDAFRRKSEDR